MTAMHFSIPDDVREAFEAAFAAEDQGAIIAELMREAVERARGARQHEAIARIVARHAAAPQMSDSELTTLRHAGRP